ncbi:LOW QUALITY PROTEIN: asialoglycoprotein receptor-like 1 [Eucyclogobius newberryi]|uniref:LOW QUALITY PROTEIN: asialoglycoprotein receptor-like 1 n=1 Tax=Eucyclogobius newberryi TaxID=166745 RepID=UPI003B590012
MEAEYHQFGTVSTEHTTVTLQKGLKNIVLYILYAVLLLLLLILLLITGVKFSQMSKDVKEIKIQLAKASNIHTNMPLAPTSAHFEAHKQTERIIEQVYLDSIIPVRGKCREGWVSYEEGCYFLSTSKEPWNIAETLCQKGQGHLLVVNSVEELDYISKVVNLRESYWIGLVERQNGHWSWVDGSDYNSKQTFWDEGQPDDWDYTEKGENCGQLHASTRRKRKLWNDADCSLTYRYICESNV